MLLHDNKLEDFAFCVRRSSSFLRLKVSMVLELFAEKIDEKHNMWDVKKEIPMQYNIFFMIFLIHPVTEACLRWNSAWGLHGYNLRIVCVPVFVGLILEKCGIGLLVMVALPVCLLAITLCVVVQSIWRLRLRSDIFHFKRKTLFNI